MLSRKVFSQRLAKGYWLDLSPGPPRANLPVFSFAESKWIKEHNLTTEELEWCYQTRLTDWRVPIMPEEPVKIEPKPKSKEESDPAVVSAREECLKNVFALLQPFKKEN